ncbi:MAG: hypothetical protein HY764_01635 [Candidatus Portnoybacteria bacterium]|nr:hypothetical protein [Candidatus Portnoybacteria bacterium]
MNIVVRADSFLIDRIFQPFGHWFQRLTGKTNFWWGIICWFFMWASFTWDILLSKPDLSGGAIAVWAIFSFFFFSMPTLLLAPLEKKVLSGVEETPPKINPLLIALFPARIFTLGLFLFSIFDAPGIGLNMGMLFLLCAYYFLSCTPLPRCTSKVREWLRKLKPKPLPAPAVENVK